MSETKYVSNPDILLKLIEEFGLGDTATYCHMRSQHYKVKAEGESDAERKTNYEYESELWLQYAAQVEKQLP